MAWAARELGASLRLFVPHSTPGETSNTIFTTNTITSTNTTINVPLHQTSLLDSL